MKRSCSNEDMAKEVEDNEVLETLLGCIQCGMCTGTCPVGKHTHLKTRTVLEKATQGDRSVLEDDDIWECAVCFACMERCTHGVRITEAILGLRTLATKEGRAPKEYLGAAKQLLLSGKALPATGLTKKMRKELGLDPIDKVGEEKVLADVKKILEDYDLLSMMEDAQ